MRKELLEAHRELQYLRALGTSPGKKKMSPSKRKSRQKYAELRWQKLQQTQRSKGS